MPKIRPNSNYEWFTQAWDRIALSQEILDACLSEAERGRSWAEGEAPVDSGRYASSFMVEAVTVSFGSYGPRVAAELSNEAPYAAAVEFGNAKAEPQRILSRTAEYLGL